MLTCDHLSRMHSLRIVRDFSNAQFWGHHLKDCASAKMCSSLVCGTLLACFGRQAQLMLKGHMYADAGVQAASRRMLDSCTGWSDIYDQCGGITCQDGGTSCSDTAYNCCPAETSCQRQNQWYWQCLPEPVSPTVQASPSGNTSPSPGMCYSQSA